MSNGAIHGMACACVLLMAAMTRQADGQGTPVAPGAPAVPTVVQQAVSAPVADSVAILRGGRGEQMGVVAVSIDGVSVGELVAGVSSARMLSWHRVKSVGGSLTEEAKQYASTADDAWRAMTRLERGDAIGAELLLEPLAKTYSRRGGPTAGAVFAGLLKCRLLRGSQTLAVDAWMSWMQAGEIAPDAGRGPGVSSWERGEEILHGGVDAATGLVPSLPPVWLNVASVRAFAGGEAMPPELGNGAGRGAQLRELYVQAARRECGLATRLPAGNAAWPDAQRLVWQMVAARIGDDAARREARAALTARLKAGATGWIEAWCRVGIGRSLMVESDAESVRDGVLQLLTLAAREDASDAYLTGIALAEASAALRAAGDTRGAMTVLVDLVRRLPDHPATEWEGVRTSVPAAMAALKDAIVPRAVDETMKQTESDGGG